jgi:MraZ protein
MDNLNLSFTGEYNNSLDQKNRLSIPAKFRKALDPINDRTFVITRGFDRCLILYPAIGWNDVELELTQLNSIKGRNRDFVRSIVRHATYVQFDSQGRVAVPDKLLAFANITKDIMVIGMIDKIEIWDQSILNDKDEHFNNEADNYEDLANEINF